MSRSFSVDKRDLQSPPALTPLQHNIRQYMTRTGLSVTALERKAGLKTNTVRNILAGLSKNPTSTTLEALSDVTGLSIPALLGREESLLPPAVQPFSRRCDGEVVQSEILDCCFQELMGIVAVEGYALSMRDITHVLKEVYTYTVEKTPPVVDGDFIRWYLARGYKKAK
jgi:transcriptional regulator with XRE-family HTH domain